MMFQSYAVMLLGVTAFCMTGAAFETCRTPVNIENCLSTKSPNQLATCYNISVCHKTFNISAIFKPPFSDPLLPIMIETALTSCCGTCIKSNYVRNYTSMKDFNAAVNTSTIEDAHLIFPILAKDGTTTYYGYHFLPLVDVHSGYYFTKKRDKSETINALLTACLNLWPLFTITLLLAFIAGAIAWFADTWKNEDEFPRPFATGVLEGFWWSFISMTTVGYGDKSPKSAQARFFAVVWILIGITICSLFTASLTTAITSSATLPAQTMNGKKVGVLSNRLFDFAFVVENGGNPYEISSDIDQLIEIVDRDKGFDGFLLDIYTKGQYERDKSKLYDEYYATLVNYGGDKLTYGMLVLRLEDYYFLNEFIRNNQLILQTCLNRLSNNLASNDISTTQNIFAPSSGLFIPSFVSCVVLLIVIVAFGLAYEWYRRKKSRSQTDMATNESVNTKRTKDVMIDDVKNMLHKWENLLNSNNMDKFKTIEKSQNKTDEV